jgi:hypothetical protein
MRQRGYDYDRPADAAADPRWWKAEGVASDEQINTAKADVECNLSTNLAGIWFTIEAKYQTEIVEAHSQELAEIVRWREKMLAKASGVTAGNG